VFIKKNLLCFKFFKCFNFLIVLFLYLPPQNLKADCFKNELKNEINNEINSVLKNDIYHQNKPYILITHRNLYEAYLSQYLMQIKEVLFYDIPKKEAIDYLIKNKIPFKIFRKGDEYEMIFAEIKHTPAIYDLEEENFIYISDANGIVINDFENLKNPQNLDFLQTKQISFLFDLQIKKLQQKIKNGTCRACKMQ
jgi:hypothetical protein